MNGTKESQKNQSAAPAANPHIGTESDERRKKCSKCGIEKIYSEYSKAKKEKLGIKSACKKCLSNSGRNYYHENKSKIGRKQSNYRNENKVSISAKSRQSYANDKKRFTGYTKKYRSENKEKVALRMKNYATNNRDLINLNVKTRRSKDLEFRLDLNFKARFAYVLRKNKTFSFLKYSDFLGCNLDFFIEYIESKFTEGMSWKNYAHNTWHLDHKLPLSSFDLTNIQQYEICFHYTNLQPLWAEDNYTKGRKLISFSKSGFRGKRA